MYIYATLYINTQTINMHNKTHNTQTNYNNYPGFTILLYNHYPVTIQSPITSSITQYYLILKHGKAIKIYK